MTIYSLTPYNSSLINITWHPRNQARFNNHFVNWKSAIAMIIASTSLSGTYISQASNNSIVDFTILKVFSCKIRHPKAPQIREVFWFPPHSNWIKCNIDELHPAILAIQLVEVFLEITTLM